LWKWIVFIICYLTVYKIGYIVYHVFCIMECILINFLTVKKCKVRAMQGHT